MIKAGMRQLALAVGTLATAAAPNMRAQTAVAAKAEATTDEIRAALRRDFKKPNYGGTVVKAEDQAKLPDNVKKAIAELGGNAQVLRFDIGSGVYGVLFTSPDFENAKGIFLVTAANNLGGAVLMYPDKATFARGVDLQGARATR